MRRAIPALLAVLVAAVAAAGCGDSGSSSTVPSKAEYKTTYASLNTQINQLGAAISNALTKSAGKSNKEISKEFNDLADRVQETAKKVDDATPPADPAIEKQQAALVAGLNTAADDLAAIGKAAGKKDLKGAGAAAGKFARDNPLVAKPHIELNRIVLGIKPAPAKTGGGTPKTTTTTAP